MVSFSQVSAGHGGRAVLEGVSFTAPKGRMTALIGPNGCGKTTLLKTACGLISPLKGEIAIDGRARKDAGRKEWARLCALLPQMREAPALTVEALVAHGRYPHLSFGRDLTAADKEAVFQAMEEAGVLSLREREVPKLSGGERQRVYFAMALAQSPGVFFLSGYRAKIRDAGAYPEPAGAGENRGDGTARSVPCLFLQRFYSCAGPGEAFGLWEKPGGFPKRRARAGFWRAGGTGAGKRQGGVPLCAALTLGPQAGIIEEDTGENSEERNDTGYTSLLFCGFLCVSRIAWRLLCG